MATPTLKKMLHLTALNQIRHQTRDLIPATLDALKVPTAPDDKSLSKAEYVESRLKLVSDTQATQVAEAFLAESGARLPASERFALEELLWSATWRLEITIRARREIAKGLEGMPLFLKPKPFLDLIQRLWDKRSSFEALALIGVDSDPFLAEIERHVIRNPDDWTPEQLFEHLEVFHVTSKRFAKFIEGLASAEIRPDEASQRAFASRVNGLAHSSGVELREVGTEGGYPCFQLVAIHQNSGRPKNLIFASRTKPDIRFRDALNNDIEIASGADQVLVFDRPFPPHGLLWKDLQEWWSEKTPGLVADKVERNLYARLRSALPRNSPPQQILFRSYFERMRPQTPSLPALIPEVWLHWDPKTIEQRGVDALVHHRMDFLMLLPHGVRIVIEVDGLHHFADDAPTGQRRPANPARYAQMMKGDRNLRLDGYEVYRFGVAELDEEGGPPLVEAFFMRLFKRYGIMP